MGLCLIQVTAVTGLCLIQVTTITRLSSYVSLSERESQSDDWQASHSDWASRLSDWMVSTDYAVGKDSSGYILVKVTAAIPCCRNNWGWHASTSTERIHGCRIAKRECSRRRRCHQWWDTATLTPIEFLGTGLAEPTMPRQPTMRTCAHAAHR